MNDRSRVETTSAYAAQKLDGGIGASTSRDQTQLGSLIAAINEHNSYIHDLTYTVRQIADRIYGCQPEAVREVDDEKPYGLMQAVGFNLSLQRSSIDELRRQINRLQEL